MKLKSPEAERAIWVNMCAKAMTRLFTWTTRHRTCAAIKECAKCGGLPPPPERGANGRLKYHRHHVDHVEPKIDPVKGWQGFDVFFERLFYGPLQPLCVPCHKAKTKYEAAIRAKARRDKKIGGGL